MLFLAEALLQSERIWLNSLLSLALTSGCSYILLYCVTLSVVKIHSLDGGKELSSQSSHHEDGRTLFGLVSFQLHLEEGFSFPCCVFGLA